MIHQVDAIFSEGALRPLEPLKIAEGSRVHLRVEETSRAGLPKAARVPTPRLAHLEEAPDFIMQVRESDNASL
jgi:predicted DNA-binding antitoxin AbrB/MazE fold protein